MSGGSYNYLYMKILDMAEDRRLTKGNALRRAFAKHLEKVAEACKAVEWVDSCDWSDDSAEIKAVLHGGAELEELIFAAKESDKELREYLERLESK